MNEYVLTLTIRTKTPAEIPAFSCTGNVDDVLEAMAVLQDPLNEAKDEDSIGSVTFHKVGELSAEQQAHGERIQERGRHNGTSEA